MSTTDPTLKRPARGARWMSLRYAGNCVQCGTRLPVEGSAFYDPDDKTICCTKIECAEKHGVTEDKWIGSPTAGHWETVLSPTRKKNGTSTTPAVTPGVSVAASTMSALLPGVSMDAGGGMVALMCPNCSHIEDSHDCKPKGSSDG